MQLQCKDNHFVWDGSTCIISQYQAILLLKIRLWIWLLLELPKSLRYELPWHSAIRVVLCCYLCKKEKIKNKLIYLREFFVDFIGCPH